MFLCSDVGGNHVGFKKKKLMEKRTFLFLFFQCIAVVSERIWLFPSLFLRSGLLSNGFSQSSGSYHRSPLSSFIAIAAAICSLFFLKCWKVELNTHRPIATQNVSFSISWFSVFERWPKIHIFKIFPLRQKCSSTPLRMHAVKSRTSAMVTSLYLCC